MDSGWSDGIDWIVNDIRLQDHEKNRNVFFMQFSKRRLSLNDVDFGDTDEIDMDSAV